MAWSVALVDIDVSKSVVLMDVDVRFWKIMVEIEAYVSKRGTGVKRRERRWRCGSRERLW